MLARLLLSFVLLQCFAPAARAALFRRRNSRPASTIALRKRVHVNTLITEPGTLEFEFGGAFSTGVDFTFPSMIKYTPEGSHIFWGRTEFSVSFDSVASTVQFDSRATQFSDRMTFASNCVVYDGDKLDIAFAPQVSWFLRDESGLRAGGTVITRYDFGRNSTGVTAAWTAATAVSPQNPAGMLDIGYGYGRRLAVRGPLGHLMAHANLLYEKSTGVARQISLFEGIEYQITGKLALDFAGQHFSVWGGPVDHQIIVGLTVNTGRLRAKCGAAAAALWPFGGAQNPPRGK